MIATALITAGAVLLSQIILIYLIYRFFPLDKIASLIADRAGRRAFSLIQNAMGGNSAAESRQSRAVEAAGMQDMLAQSKPELMAILDMFPTLKKKTLSNPALLMKAVEWLGKQQGDNGAKKAESSSSRRRINYG